MRTRNTLPSSSILDQIVIILLGVWNQILIALERINYIPQYVGKKFALSKHDKAELTNGQLLIPEE